LGKFASRKQNHFLQRMGEWPVHGSQRPENLGLSACVEKLTFEQIVAMVDKWHADHREERKNPISTEIVEAVTAPRSPCAGMSVGA
jgi:hypothetical protein